MVSISTEYISVGGNRHPAAADWDVQSGILAYGADNNVALWDPLVRAPPGLKCPCASKSNLAFYMYAG